MKKNLTDEQYEAMRAHRDAFVVAYLKSLRKGANPHPRKIEAAWQARLTEAWLNDYREQWGILREVRNNVGISEAFEQYADITPTRDLRVSLGDSWKGQTCPAWVQWDGTSKGEAGDGLAWWSGDKFPANVGDGVKLRVNDIGPAIVIGYAAIHGFLALVVMPTKPPKWYVQQNGQGCPCVAYGAEVQS